MVHETQLAVQSLTEEAEIRVNRRTDSGARKS